MNKADISWYCITGKVMQSNPNIDKKISEISSMVHNYTNMLAIYNIQTEITKLPQNKFRITLSADNKKTSEEFEEKSFLLVDKSKIMNMVNDLENKLNEKPFPRNRP